MIARSQLPKSKDFVLCEAQADYSVVGFRVEVLCELHNVSLADLVWWLRCRMHRDWQASTDTCLCGYIV